MPPIDDTSLEDSDQQWEGLSLEELGQAYAQVVARTESATAGDHTAQDADTTSQDGDASLADDDLAVDAVPSLGSIIEGALFIGHADGRGIHESELAAL